MGLFEEQMSSAIIEEHLADIRDRYSEIKNGSMSRSGSSTVISGIKALVAAGVRNTNDYRDLGYVCKLNSGSFLPVPEIIKKLGLEGRMQEILDSKSARLKGPASLKKNGAESSHPINDRQRSPRQREASPKVKTAARVDTKASQPRTDPPIGYYRSSLPDQFGNSGTLDDSEASGTEALKSGWVNLANLVFELDDQFYVQEDMELLFEIDQNARRTLLRRLSDDNSNHLGEDEEDNAEKEIMVKKNFEFLAREEVSSNENSLEMGLSDSDQEPTEAAHISLSPWSHDFLDGKALIESQSVFRFNTSLMDERSSALRILKVSPVPANAIQPIASQAPPPGKKKKLKQGFQEETGANSGPISFTMNELLYKVDSETLARIKKLKKTSQNVSQAAPSQTQSILEPLPEHSEPTPQMPKVNPQLLINHIDPKLLEKEEQVARSSSEDISASPNKTTTLNRGATVAPEVEEPAKGKAGKKSKKSKKTTNTLVLVDDETEQKTSGLLGSLISSKKQGKKARQAAKQQKAAEEQAKQQKEELNLDEVSEIPHERSEDGEMLAESLENPMGDENESGRNGETSNRQLESEFLEEEGKTGLLGEGETGEVRESSEGLGQKKKKKKPKKAGQPTGKALASGKADPLFEELTQVDKEKDLLITEVDTVLRRAGHENIVSLILQVLDNNSMSEEYFVDKRRYYTKYVYVADAVGHQKGLVLPNK